MRWPSFSGIGRQRQQMQDSVARLTERRLDVLSQAREENTRAAAEVTETVEKRLEEGRPIRSLLQDLLAKIHESEVARGEP